MISSDFFYIEIFNIFIIIGINYQSLSTINNNHYKADEKTIIKIDEIHYNYNRNIIQMKLTITKLRFKLNILEALFIL